MFCYSTILARGAPIFRPTTRKIRFSHGYADDVVELARDAGVPQAFSSAIRSAQ